MRNDGRLKMLSQERMTYELIYNVNKPNSWTSSEAPIEPVTQERQLSVRIHGGHCLQRASLARGAGGGSGKITEINLNSFGKQSHSMTYSLTSSTAHLIMFSLHYSFFWKMKAGWGSHLLTDAGKGFEISTHAHTKQLSRGAGGGRRKRSDGQFCSWSWHRRPSSLVWGHL